MAFYAELLYSQILIAVFAFQAAQTLAQCLATIVAWCVTDCRGSGVAPVPHAVGPVGNMLGAQWSAQPDHRIAPRGVWPSPHRVVQCPKVKTSERIMNEGKTAGKAGRPSRTRDEEIAATEAKLKRLREEKKEDERRDRERNQKAILAQIKEEGLDEVDAARWKEVMPKLRDLLKGNKTNSTRSAGAGTSQAEGEELARTSG